MTKKDLTKKVPFEESLKKLEEVVLSLEGQNISLDKSIEGFEEGMKLVKECESRLKEAEGKVEQLIKDSSGNLKTVEFNTNSER